MSIVALLFGTGHVVVAVVSLLMLSSLLLLVTMSRTAGLSPAPKVHAAFDC
jgi:hypothetical protein